MRFMLNDIFQSIDPIAFALGPLQVRWYGLAYIAGFAFGALLIYRYGRHWRIRFTGEDVLTYICAVAFGVIFGARIGYCLVYGDGYFFSHPAEILAVSNGGMSFHGGLVGACIATVLFAVVMKMPLLTLCDLLACGAPAGLFFGRCANFINGELYGAETALPIGVDFTNTGVMYHPSQLYEACLEGLVLLLVLFVLSRRVPARSQGIFSGTFLVLYACFRILVEFVRLPDAQIGYFFGTWGTMGQLLCLPMLLLGIGLIAYGLIKKKPQQGIELPEN